MKVTSEPVREASGGISQCKGPKAGRAGPVREEPTTEVT